MKAKIIFDLCSKALDIGRMLFWALQEFCINISGRDTVTSKEIQDKIAEVCRKYGVEPE